MRHVTAPPVTLSSIPRATVARPAQRGGARPVARPSTAGVTVTRQELARELADVRAAYAALAPEVSALLRLLARVRARRLLAPAA